MTALTIAGWVMFILAVAYFEFAWKHERRKLKSALRCIGIWRAENKRLRGVVLGKNADLEQVRLNLEFLRKKTLRKRDRKGRFA